MSENVVQCRLAREQDGHRVVLITWVPENLAIKNKKVKLDNTGEIFTVTKTYTMLDKTSVIENSKDYRKTRQFSDI
jgi:hypothetical protein